MAENKDFFKEEYPLQTGTFTVDKEEQFINASAVAVLKQMLAEEETFQVIARLSFTMLFGWYKNGELIFSTPVEIDDADVEEIRAFNDSTELLLQRRRDVYWVRRITDKAGDEMTTVDSTSCLFGKITGTSVAEGFAELYEPGRKIRLVIPANDAAKEDTYTITTRSYIQYDETTGQAGYGFSRYLAIRKERRRA